LIKAIFLDCAGVITQLGSVFESMTKRFPDGPTMEKARELFSDAKIGKMSNAEYLNHFSEECFLWCLNQVSEHEGIMSFLKANSLPVFIASNHISKIINKELNIIDVREYFNDIFVSDKLKLAKPNKAFYEKVLELSGYKANESIFVDDQKKNLVVPKALGMTTIWVNNTKTDPYGDNANTTPDHSIYKIDELLPIIEQLNQK
jgi:HAD superfamily hydrolase (TIGR01509 family)